MGGHLRNGDAGIRLFDYIERLATRQYVAPQVSVQTTNIDEGQAKLVPIYNLYASSMMASRSPLVAEQLPIPAWRIGVDDARAWGIAAGDYLAIDIDKQHMTLPVQLVPYLAEGCIGYPVGQVAITHPSLPASVRKVDAPVTMTGALAADTHADTHIHQTAAAPTTTQEV